MKKTREEQVDLFKRIKMSANLLSNLAGYVQNDFDMMLADGTVTKLDIANSIADARHDFDKLVQHVRSLEEEVVELLKSHAG